MKRMMSVAMIALFVAGSTAFACDGCGCTAKKAEKKAECSACDKGKAKAKCGADSKKECGADSKKECGAKKVECAKTK